MQRYGTRIVPITRHDRQMWGLVMLNPTSQRATELASQFEAAAEGFALFIEELSDEQWKTFVPGEERTVAALARHVGWAFGYLMIAFTAFAEGRPFATVTKDQVDALNAAHGTEYADCPQDDTVAFIRAEAAKAAAEVRKFNAAALARRGLYADFIEERSVETYIERPLIGHVGNHAQTIRDALGLDSGLTQ